MEVRTKQEAFERLRQNEDALAQLGVARYGLFGSFARAMQHEKSDVDILVEFVPEKKNFDNFMKLSFLLEEILGRKVDLVTREALSPFIGKHILAEVEYAAAR